MQDLPNLSPSQRLPVIRREQHSSWQRGEDRRVEAYLDLYPQLASSDESVVDLIYSEFWLREERGDAPSREEYLRRFPQYAERLNSLFELGEADLNGDSSRKPLAIANADDTDRNDTEAERSLGEEAVDRTHADAKEQLRDNIDTMTHSMTPIDVTVEGGPPPKADEDTVSGDTIDSPRPAKRSVRLTSGSPFGDYELLEEIARGGMGVVYRARQNRLNRIVALKTILAGELANEEQVRRFHIEAEAAAQLSHKNLVSIYEVGEHDGQHFFSMELVEGSGLDGRLSDGPLPPREAARIVKAVAEAMHFAHARGVVHRDLKPSNILIDAAGEPKVTDFGLAKQMQGDSELTASGQVIGTPSFMPPEQAEGRWEDVGPLADVYSLGAVLYCTLTSRPPFQAAGILETLKQVLEQDPVSPQQLNPSVDCDLETICLKCLDKSPERRYTSAQELADDLARFLDARPIVARPISLGGRFYRWCRRNPVVSGLLAATVVSLVIGTIASTTFAFRAIANAKLAELRLQEIGRKNEELGDKNEQLGIALDRAEQLNEEAKGAISHYVDVVLDDQLLSDRAFQPLRKRLIADALMYYEDFVREHGSEQTEAGRRELALALDRIAYITDKSGSKETSLDANLKSIAIFKALHDEKPEDRQRLEDLAAQQRALADVYRDLGRLDEAGKAYEQALQYGEQLLNAAPQNAACLSAMAKAQHNFGMLLHDSERLDEAAGLFDNARQTFKQLADADSAATSYRINLSNTLSSLARVHSSRAEPWKALELYDQVRDICHKLVEEDASFRHLSLLAGAYHNAGTTYHRIGDRKAADLGFREAIKINEHLVAKNPAMSDSRHALALNFLASARCQLGLDRADEAETNARRARDLFAGLILENLTVPEFRAGEVTAGSLLARILYTQGKDGESLELLEATVSKAQALADESDNPSHRNTEAVVRRRLAVLYQETGAPSKAVVELMRTREIAETLSRDYPNVPQYLNELASTYGNLGGLYRVMSQHEKASEAAKLAQDVRKRLANQYPDVSSHQYDYAKGYNNLAAAFLSAKDLEAGLQAIEEGNRVQKELLAENPGDVELRSMRATNRLNAGAIHLGANSTAAALAALEECREITQSLIDEHESNHDYLRTLGDCLGSLGSVHRNSNKPGEAIELYRQSVTIFRKLSTLSPDRVLYQERVAKRLNSIALVALGAGQNDEANVAFGESIDVQQRIVDNHPELSSARVGLAGTLIDRSKLQSPEEAVVSQGRGIQLLEEVLAENENNRKVQRFLYVGHVNRAQAHKQLGRHMEAANDWSRAFELAAPSSKSGLMVQVLLSLARSGQHETPTEKAQQLLEIDGVSNSFLYNAACIFALSADAALKDEAIDAAKREELATNYRKTAIEALQRCCENGYYKTLALVDHTANDSDLASLKGEPVFKQLLENLRKEVEDEAPSSGRSPSPEEREER